MTPGRPKGGELSERDTASQRGASPSGSPGRISVPASMNTPAPSTSDASGGQADEIDDLTLVRRAQQGDRGAFKSLFERYHRRVYAVALSVLKSPPDAHDVVQEAFVKVHRHLADFQGASSFYTWLYRISMNLSIDQLRRRKSGRHVEYDDSAEAS
ncbi:MAG: polymerase sigma factor RpoE, partial [Myxococcaceae bacterium]|nr:polymerase sigma factor RpoE [Myxococcaceae bacterium]